MGRVFANTWVRMGVGVLFVGVLIFFSETRGVLFFRETALRAAGALAKNPVGFFFFPRGSLGASGTSENENAELSRLRFENDILTEENETLERVLDASREAGVSVKSANVFSYANEMGRESLLLTAGTEQGVNKGALVFDPSFVLVGTVVEATRSVSKVDVASNAGNTFEARIIPTATHVVAKGLGGGVFELDLVPIDTPVRSGDFVGVSPKRDVPSTRSAFFLGEVVGESKTESTVFKPVRAISPVLPATLSSVFILP